MPWGEAAGFSAAVLAALQKVAKETAKETIKETVAENTQTPWGSVKAMSLVGWPATRTI
jgi:hypothetical protein